MQPAMPAQPSQAGLLHATCADAPVRIVFHKRDSAGIRDKPLFVALLPGLYT